MDTALPGPGRDTASPGGGGRSAPRSKDFLYKGTFLGGTFRKPASCGGNDLVGAQPGASPVLQPGSKSETRRTIRGGPGGTEWQLGLRKRGLPFRPDSGLH